MGISPEGWQIVAGGCSEAKTTGTNQKELHPKGCEKRILQTFLIWHLVYGAIFSPALTTSNLNPPNAPLSDCCCMRKILIVANPLQANN